MANSQLTAYIQENLSKFSKEAIIQSLSSAGWSAIDISAAFMELEHPAPIQKPTLSQPAAAPARPAGGSAPSVAIPPASAIAIEIPVAAPLTSTPPVQIKPQPSDTNDAFLAEMTKRRKEAEALNPQVLSQGDVTFSVGSTQSPAVTQGGLVGMVLKTGLVKTEQQANIVLICVAVVCFGFSLWFIL